MRRSFYRFPEDSDQMVRFKEGCAGVIPFRSAWTEHYERDGTLFEVTEIHLTGNNSRFKYNHHL